MLRSQVQPLLSPLPRVREPRVAFEAQRDVGGVDAERRPRCICHCEGVAEHVLGGQPAGVGHLARTQHRVLDAQQGLPHVSVPLHRLADRGRGEQLAAQLGVAAAVYEVLVVRVEVLEAVVDGRLLEVFLRREPHRAGTRAAAVGVVADGEGADAVGTGEQRDAEDEEEEAEEGEGGEDAVEGGKVDDVGQGLVFDGLDTSSVPQFPFINFVTLLIKLISNSYIIFLSYFLTFTLFLILHTILNIIYKSSLTTLSVVFLTSSS